MLRLLASTTETADEGGSGLIEVVPGLMIWTLICFGIAFFVLRKFAFGPIQKTIDDRRERIRNAVQEADNARAEAARLLEEHRALIGQAKQESADILAETRKVAEAQIDRAKQEAEADRQRRLEETRKQIEAETARAIGQIRGEVADLTLEATQRVVGKVLDSEDQRRLIEEAVEGLDFSALEGRGELVAVAHAIYAKALYEAAHEQGKVDIAQEQLAELATRVRDDAGARGVPREPATRAPREGRGPRRGDDRRRPRCPELRPARGIQGPRR